MPDKTQLELDVVPAFASLAELARAENACTRCPLYKDATQAVPGEGRRHAHLMLVGEQPGDKEDLAGKPFVDPPARSWITLWQQRKSRARRFSSPTR